MTLFCAPRDRRALRQLAALGCLLLALLPAARAQPAVLPSASTTLQSTAERMISYRHQDHMWQTADGAIHLLMNRGTVAAGTSLRMVSSFDGGTTWVGGPSLAETNGTSTSDGTLEGDDLFVTYSTSAGTVAFAQMRYDAVAKAWSLAATETAFASAERTAFNPSMAVDALGTRWLAFTSQETASANYSIKLLRRTSEAEGWVDTGLVFGATDNLSIERSARPVATANGMGMVYTVHRSMYWAYRDNRLPVGSNWTRKLLFTSRAADVDPYGSHFSVARDSQGHLHMAMVDAGKVRHFKLPAGSQAWTSKTLTKDVSATYVQALVALGNVVLITNAGNALRVYQSGDAGASFSYTHRLTHPAATGTVVYDRPRVEAPAVAQGPIPVLQQYADGSRQRALYFSVPVAGLTTGPAACVAPCQAER